MPALEEAQPVATYALLSGGHDSAAVARWAAEHLRLDALLHIDTTIGVDETREYVRALAHDLGVPLVIDSRTDDGAGYEELVAKFGFPTWCLSAGDAIASTTTGGLTFSRS